nr:isoform 2 of protein nedd1 [Quercus suber]
MALLAASGGDIVKLFDVSVKAGDPCALTYTPSPSCLVNSVKWNHTNLVVASAGDDKKIALWRKNGQSLGTISVAGADSGDNIEFIYSSMTGEQIPAPSSPRDGDDVPITLGRPKPADLKFGTLMGVSVPCLQNILGIIYYIRFSCLNSLKFQFPSCIPWTSDDDDKEALLLSPAASKSDSSSSQLDNEKVAWVTREDADHLCRLVEEKDAGPAWIQMMDRSTSTMSYQAWRRDPETGPPQYRSRTVYEDATPELVRDFFWDDEF